MNRRHALALLFALALVIYAFPLLRGWWIGQHAEPRAVSPRGDLAADEQTIIDIFARVSPSVVYITTTRQAINLWTRNVFEVPAGSGSGFVWDGYGHVVTNFHVVQGAQRASVRLNDDRAYDAVLVGASPTHDLAVLRINVSFDPPEPIPVGTSADLKVGQKVLAIGNPFGLDRTLTTGVISALDRTIPSLGNREIEHVIQTDAAINPGNSGGPLIDSAGRLIGINTQIISPSGAYAGIGFAVPVDTVNRVVPQLIAEGKYLQPVLGVTLNDEVSQRVTAQLGVEGVLVLEVRPGSTAERAGLQGSRLLRNGTIHPGDVILSIDGKRVSDTNTLLSILDEYSVGDEVTLRVFREGRDLELSLALEGA